MPYILYHPEKILIEPGVENHPITQAILQRLPGVPVEVLDDPNVVVQSYLQKADPLTAGMKILYLGRQEGRFLKPCPGTSNYLCCGYNFLNIATHCDIDCSYCILQGYLNNPFMRVYVNLEDLFNEVETFLATHQQQVFRIGTGELTDSLTLDHITQYSRQLVPFFAHQTNAILELKTKTTNIDNLLDLPHRGRTMVSWSLNPNRLIETEEKKAPALEERLAAARKCQEAGYLLGFHFDPLICYDGWESDYHDVVEQIFDTVNPDGIGWISLGALRYPAHVDEIIRRRHPESCIVLEELIPGKDGKLRYFRPIREEMFRQMISWIHALAPQVTVYLCMESPEVWQKVYPDPPIASCPLSKILDRAVFPRAR